MRRPGRIALLVLLGLFASGVEAQTSCDVEGGDVTALRLKARDLAAEGAYGSALAAIDCARRIAPADLDIRMARAHILLWSGDVAGARREAEEVRGQAPDYPELDQLDRAIDAAAQAPTLRKGALFLSSGASDVDAGGNHRTWWGFSLGGYGQLDEFATLAATVEYEDRSYASDTKLSARLERRIGSAGVYLSASGTPNADFRERWGLGAGAELPVAGITALLDYRHARYAASSIDVVSPGVRIPIVTDRLSATIKGTVAFAEQANAQLGVSGRLDANLGGDIDLALGLATYPDTEAGITRQVRGGYAGIGVPVTDRLRLRFTADYERREGSYTRKGVAVVLAWRLGQ